MCIGGAVGIEVRDQIMERMDPGLDPVDMVGKAQQNWWQDPHQMGGVQER